MGIPLVGSAFPLVGAAFMLELGRRRGAPLSAARVIAAVIGGFIGWGIDKVFGLSLIRLVVPKESPTTFLQAVITALFIGALSGGISSLAGLAVYQAKKWKASPVVRLRGRRRGDHRDCADPRPHRARRRPASARAAAPSCGPRRSPRRR